MTLWRWFRRLIGSRRMESELERELAYHTERRRQELIDAGHQPDEAVRLARLELGGIEQIKEECRDARGTRWFQNLAVDLRHAARVLLRSPGFAAVAILSLALGTGANTAVFQLIDAVRLRSLPVAKPAEIVEIEIEGGTRGFGNHRLDAKLTYPMWEEIRARQEVFTGVFAWAPSSVSIGQEPNAQSVRAAWVSGEVFEVLGVTAQRGRLFTRADDRPGCDLLAVISDSFWRRHFGGAEGAVGSELTLSGRKATVMGVTPPGYFGIEVGRNVDVTTLFCTVGPQNRTARHNFWVWTFGRLKPGWTAERAASYLNSASASWLAAVAPENYTATLTDVYNSFRLTANSRPNGISPLRDAFEAPLWLLWGVTGLVLAIACANLGNLTLARTLARGREVATRLALGGSHARVVFQLFSESLILAVAAGGVSALMVGVLSRFLMRFLREQDSRVILDLAFDWRTLLFLTALAMTACLLFGLATAVYATRPRVLATAETRVRGATADRKRFSLQHTLIAGQVGISLVLVAASLMFLESFRNLSTLDAGFAQEGIAFFDFNLRPSGISAGGLPQMKRQLVDAARSTPGIAAAALTTHIPLVGGNTTLSIPDPATGGDTFPRLAWVSPGYFATMETPLIAGRDFNDFDRANSPPVAVVNEVFARRYFGNANPVGQTFRTLKEPGFPEQVYEVIGLTPETAYSNPREGMQPVAYLAEAQQPSGMADRTMRLVVRSQRLGPETTERIEQAFRGVNAGVTHTGTVYLREEVLESLARERLLATLSGVFGLLALLLVAIGLYGVVSYMMSVRRREIGIRMALGADARSVLAMVLRQTLWVTLAGCSIGAIVTWALARVVRGLLFEVAPGDPAVFGMSIGVLLAVAMAAAYVPGRAAARTNPVETLRSE